MISDIWPKPFGSFFRLRCLVRCFLAVVEYNKNPYDLDDDLTVEELYEKWTKEYFKTLTSHSSERTIKSAWNYCSSIYKMRAKDLRPRHIKGCMEEGTYVSFKLDR